MLINLRDLFNEKSHKEKKIGKGIKKCVLDKKIDHDDYDNTLINKTQLVKDMNFIKSTKHQVNTITVKNKICLSCFDNKRFLLNDGITSYAFGSYRIVK